MRNKKILGYMVNCLLAVIACCFLCVTNAGALTCETNPGKIPITLGYHGTKVEISGKDLTANDLIVQIHSDLGEEHLKYIGKAGGIFWMKLGNMIFENVPAVYLVYSTKPIHDIIPHETCKELSISFDALRKKAEIKSDLKNLDREKWLNEFLKFKKEQHLYHEESGIIHVDSANHSYTVTIDWPFEAPPGEYYVEVFAIQDGKVVDKAESKIKVERVGIEKTLSHMAFEKPALYGIIAIVVAIVAGFGVGMVFKGGGGH